MLAGRAEPVRPGEVVDSVVLVQNLGTDPDTFDVMLHGDAAPWAELDESSVQLGPNEERSVWVRFRVPAALVPAGTDLTAAYVVTVSSRNDPTFIHAERGDLVVRRDGADSSAPPAAGGVEAADPTLVVTAPVEAVASRADRLDEDEAEAEADASRSLTRALTRSALVFGAFLAVGYLAVSTIDDEANAPARRVDEAATVPTLPETTVPPPIVAPEPEPSAAIPPAERPAPAVEDTPADLPLLAFVRWYGPGDRDLVVRDPGTNGRELRLRSPGSVESVPAVSPDESRIAYVRERGGAWQACTIARSGGDPTCLVDVTSGSTVAWRPDGGALYVTRGTELVELVLSADRRSVERSEVLPITIPTGVFALAPGGDEVAFVEGNRIVIRPLVGEGGRNIAVPTRPESPSFTPDGASVVYTAETAVYLAPLSGGAIRRLTAPATVNGEAVVAGRWVVFRSNRSGNGDLYAVRLDAVNPEEGLAVVTTAAERDAEPAA